MEGEPIANMVEIVSQIVSRAMARDLPFLLIGGNAVILYGVPRLTLDIDLLIPDRAEVKWITFLDDLNYSVYYKTNAFIQLEPDGHNDLPPIDLMLVDESTWGKLESESRTKSLDEDVIAPLPHPMHLVAMKLQATNSPNRRSNALDWSDLVQIIKAQDLNLADEEFSAIIDKYGGSDAMHRLKRDLQ